MTDAASIVVIGGGHNGLVCATYLARAGRRVVVLEAGEQVGGGAQTREFHPGFRVSGIAHLLYGLDTQVLRELGLDRLGLTFAQQDLRSIALHETAPALVCGADGALSGPVAESERAAYRRFLEARTRFASVLADWHADTPPRLQFERWRDLWPVARLGWALRRRGQRDMRELLRIATMSVHDWLVEQFADPRLQGALALDAVLGTRAGPRSGGTVFTLLHRAAGGGRLAVPRGGMGALSAALREAAQAAGVEIRTGSRVKSIVVEQGRASAVMLEGGTILQAGGIVAAIDPKRSLLSLLGARHLETEFARRVHHLRSIGTAAKLHLALSAPPQFQGLDAALLGERLLLAPDLDYVERAFNPAKYGEYSPQPVMEIHVPTVKDASLAPPQQHVLSAIVQYAPSDLRAGWPGQRAAFLELCIATLERHAPGIHARIVHAELQTPADIEARTGASGGHWHHGELALDQYLMLRPVPGAAQYRSPVPGLFLASAGTHPGGGITGTPGRLAARELLRAEGLA
jgi:phytoene dehydrogenase-like protein